MRLRHLPLFEVPVWIELRPKRYRCPTCDNSPTSTQKLSWYEQRSPNTKGYEQWLLRLLVNSTVSDVSCKLNLSESIVTGVLERWMETSVNWSHFVSIEVIGIDEIALKRGHRDFMVIVTTRTSQGVRVLAVLADRKRETVLAFFNSIPTHLKETIATVCTDMYLGYVNAAKEALPDARIVVDRFHVATGYRDCADGVRKREMKRLKQELSKESFLSHMGINRCTKQLLLFGPTSLGEIGFTNTWTDQGIAQVQLLMGHLRQQEEIGQHTIILLEFLQV